MKDIFGSNKRWSEKKCGQNPKSEVRDSRGGYELGFAHVNMDGRLEEEGQAT